MEITFEQLTARIKEKKESIVSELASSHDIADLYRCQGDFRTLEWILGLPDQIEAEQELDRQRLNDADDV